MYDSSLAQWWDVLYYYCAYLDAARAPLMLQQQCSRSRVVHDRQYSAPLTKLREIEASYTKEGAMRCMLEMVQYWLDTTPAACWEQVARALEQVNQLTLAATIKQKYLWDQPSSIDLTGECMDQPPGEWIWLVYYFYISFFVCSC